MVKLQKDMMKYYDEDNVNEVKLEGSLNTVLPDHDIMLPHWNKFAKALRGRTSVEEFEIVGISMPAEAVDTMFSTFQTMDLNVITFCDTGLGIPESLKLISFLRKNSSLREVYLGGEILGNASVASALSDAVNNHPNLETLMLVGCCHFDQNTDILGTFLEGCKRLLCLTIATCDVGSEAVPLLADFIRANYPTKNLDLSRNNISDIDTLLLAAALKNNTHLESLYMRGNDVTEEGDNVLLNVMFDPINMDSVVESNHLCRVYTYDTNNELATNQRPPLEQEVIGINIDDELSIQQKIRAKVVLALCGIDGGLFDLSHFNDLPLPLMPRVLQLIQEHTVTRAKACLDIPNTNQLEKDSLSRLFHTLRGWELPLLFENLNAPSADVIGKRKRRKTRL